MLVLGVRGAKSPTRACDHGVQWFDVGWHGDGPVRLDLVEERLQVLVQLRQRRRWWFGRGLLGIGVRGVVHHDFIRVGGSRHCLASSWLASALLRPVAPWWHGHGGVAADAGEPGR